MHIATPNKKGNSLSMGFYREIRAAAIEGRKRFLYETNVGAGLPVIDTFRNMLKSGDRLIHFSGVLSGSLSYIFGRLDEGASFSAAVLEARAKGFTEPDPRDDLSGADVARKALIVAREAGAEVELADVRVDPVFPADFDLSGTVDEFLARLPAVDPWFADRVSTLRARGKVLRFAAHSTGGDPDAPRGPGAFGATARVGLLEVDLADPLAAIKGGENAFVFTTKYYSPIPLVIRGYGAGADVTASGILRSHIKDNVW
jgi:aspartokinase/homoserine dehydrogenase 1